MLGHCDGHGAVRLRGLLRVAGARAEDVARRQDQAGSLEWKEKGPQLGHKLKDAPSQKMGHFRWIFFIIYLSCNATVLRH